MKVRNIELVEKCGQIYWSDGKITKYKYIISYINDIGNKCMMWSSNKKSAKEEIRRLVNIFYNGMGNNIEH